MSASKLRPLAAGYTAQVDTVDEAAWTGVLRQFDDANIYQTWPYATVIGGRRNASYLVVHKDGEVAAAAQVRIAKVPLLKLGIAYVRWGPFWRRTGAAADPDVFRQAIRALRNEYAGRRGLVLRLFPVLFEDDSPAFAEILAEEGFSSAGVETRSQTILMDVAPPLEKLRDGMRPHWKRELKLAERKNLTIAEGTSDELFESVIGIHREMVSRKRFVEGNDIHQFREMQAQLPDHLKMKVMLARSEAGVCAGAIWSAIGRTSLYLFGATSNVGMKSNGSYLLHWTILERLKHDGVSVHDLNGINPEKNPGTYKFKHDFAGEHGRTTRFLGQFDAHANAMSQASVQWGEKLRALYQKYKDTPKGSKLRPTAAS